MLNFLKEKHKKKQAHSYMHAIVFIFLRAIVGPKKFLQKHCEHITCERMTLESKQTADCF